MDLKNYNLEQKALEMLDEFGGIEDAELLFNVVDVDGHKVQFKLQLVDQSSPEFNSYDGALEYSDFDGGLKPSNRKLI